MHEGHCFCGFVRYEVDGPFSHETVCHCSACRRLSAAPFVAWFTAPRDRYRVVDGEPASVRSSDHGTRTFCPRCGTPLTFTSTRWPDEVDVTVGSLVDPAAVPPRDQVFVDSGVSWALEIAALPRHADARS